MSLKRKSSRGKPVTMSINAGELRDSQLCDDEAYDSEAYQEDLTEIYDRIDEISSDLYGLLQKCDRKNVRNAYGTIQRCMAYLHDEL